jgi:hypothetical protein
MNISRSNFVIEAGVRIVTKIARAENYNYQSDLLSWSGLHIIQWRTAILFSIPRSDKLNY